MRKIRFKRLFLVLIVAMIFVGVALFIVLQRQGEDLGLPQQTQPQPIAPAGSALELPQLPLTPQTMTDAQRDAAIATAAEDAFNAARASGQSEEQAQNAAESARTAAQSVFYPSRLNP